MTPRLCTPRSMALLVRGTRGHRLVGELARAQLAGEYLKLANERGISASFTIANASGVTVPGHQYLLLWRQGAPRSPDATAQLTRTEGRDGMPWRLPLISTLEEPSPPA